MKVVSSVLGMSTVRVRLSHTHELSRYKEKLSLSLKFNSDLSKT
jgi:hypothetical protein